MVHERLNVRADPVEGARRVRSLIPGGASVSAAVTEIIGQVASGGDVAVRACTERFDTGRRTGARAAGELGGA